MREYPRISIVTPVFNQAQYIEETVQSVLGQHYPNLEYIIIDGGSTDGTVDIIKKYEPQLAYWVSEPDNGMYDALQKGFDHCTGEIMGWLNADDLYFPRALFAVAEAFRTHEKANWITSHHTVIDKDGTIIYNKPSIQYSKYYFYLPSNNWQGNEIGQESTFWRRSLWNIAGAKIDTSLRLAGDFELWIRFFQYDTLTVVNSLFGMFRSREGQLSSNMSEYYSESEKVLKNYPIVGSERHHLRKCQRKLKIERLFNKIINKL